MHYAFDRWMDRKFPGCPFERYADDAVVHCANRSQAEEVLAAITERMAEVGLKLHPDKTRVVYCQDGKRRGNHEHTGFTFLGFAFRARKARSRDGEYFSSLLPAMSPEALQAKSAQLRSMRLHRRIDLTWTTWPDGSTPSSPGG
jgi:RNA-directed DNA polymerase